MRVYTSGSESNNSFAPGDPAAGFDAQYPVPAGHRYYVTSFTARFTASAVALNRRIRYVVRNNASRILWMSEARVVQTASQKCWYAASLNAIGGTVIDTPGVQFGCVNLLMPDIVMEAGWQFGLEVYESLIDPGDAWTLVEYNAQDTTI